ncbi:MAG: hypothetical protein LBJ75_01550 [Puniceicoccales bacterium]|jgi:hypothetical protein|nr:hypothetical protein [Puniceicoccales bacterium]
MPWKKTWGNGEGNTMLSAAPKQSFWGHAKHFVERGFSNVGDFVAGEEPVILPTGKDYLMGDDIRQKAAPTEVKVALASAALLPALAGAAEAGGAVGAAKVGKAMVKLAARGIEAVAKAIDSNTPGGLTLATPNGATLTGAVEVAPAAVGVAEGIGVGTVTTTAIGSDFPLSMSLKKEKIPGQRSISNAGSGKELTDGIGPGGFQDGKEVHHIVPQRYLKRHDIDPDEGLSVILPEKVHKQTGTYKGKAKNFNLDQSFRDATAEGLRDTIRVEKEHGMYESGGRENLVKGLEKHKEKYPELYEKGTMK